MIKIQQKSHQGLEVTTTSQQLCNESLATEKKIECINDSLCPK